MSAIQTLFDQGILINLLLQATLLTGAALLVANFFRRSSVTRYTIAWSALMSLFLLVFASLAIQFGGWTSQSLQFDLFANETTTLQLEPAPDATQSPVFTVEEPVAAELDLPLFLGFKELVTPQQLREVGAWTTPTLLAIWATGIVIGLLRLLGSAHALVRMRASTAPIDGDAGRRLERIITGLGLKANAIPVVQSASLSTPALVGFHNPFIVLPTSVVEHANDEQLRCILTHELAHWQRRDNLAQVLESIVAIFFWVVPFVHVLRAIAARSREEICDNYVLAHQDPLAYGETLLWVGSHSSSSNHAGSKRAIALSATMVDSKWNLEQRINEIIDEKREITMTLSNTGKTATQLLIAALILVISPLVVVPGSSQLYAQSTDDSAPQVEPEEQAEQRPPPRANSAETLGEAIFNEINVIQSLMSPTEEDVEPDLDAAKQRLDELYAAEFGQSNAFEKQTILNFYTNYYLSIQDYESALSIFEQLLTVDGLRADTELRTLRSLGQLYMAQEQWEDTIEAYSRWRDLSEDEDSIVFRGLSYANYQLERWEESLELWLQYMDITPDTELDRDDYAYLNGLYFVLEDFEQAKTLTEEMIVKFNHETDWRNYRAILVTLNNASDLEDIDPDNGSTLDLSGTEPQIAFATVVPTDGDYMPLVATAPQYPRQAADEGIEGWVLLEFTVLEDGRVHERSISVVDSEPEQRFDRTSIRAASSFVFAPRMMNGETVPVPGVQYLFRFKLGDDDA